MPSCFTENTRHGGVCNVAITEYTRGRGLATAWLRKRAPIRLQSGCRVVLELFAAPPRPTSMDHVADRPLAEGLAVDVTDMGSSISNLRDDDSPPPPTYRLTSQFEFGYLTQHRYSAERFNEKPTKRIAQRYAATVLRARTVSVIAGGS